MREAAGEKAVEGGREGRKGKGPQPSKQDGTTPDNHNSNRISRSAITIKQDGRGHADKTTNTTTTTTKQRGNNNNITRQQQQPAAK